MVNQPGLISIEVLTEKHKPDAYFALTCWEDQDALDTWLNSDLCKDVRNRLDPVDRFLTVQSLLFRFRG